MSGWSLERIEQLKQLWSEGLTGKEIAEKMGDLSRSAVLGAASRYRLPARIIEHRPPANAPPIRTRPPTKTFLAVVELAKTGLHPLSIAARLGRTKQSVYGIIGRARQLGENIPYQLSAFTHAKKPRPAYGTAIDIKPKKVARPVVPDEPESLDLTVMELRPGQCKWPHGDGPFFFCGQPAEESYCPHHAGRAYRQPEKRIYIGRAA